MKISTPIEATEVASDCKCVLGKCLYGAGKITYSKLSEYKIALNAHANFHLTAAEAVIEHQSGRVTSNHI